jgi:hypothetical protein
MVRVSGDVVRQAQAAFLTSFRAHGARLLMRERLFEPEIVGSKGDQPPAGTRARLES